MSFIDLLETTKEALGINCKLITGFNADIAFNMTRPVNWLTNDILIDKTDLDLMTCHITKSDKEPLGRIAYSDWVKDQKDTLGMEYINSLQRYYKK